MASIVVVTGATGFVPSNAVRLLTSRGDQVIAVDRRPPDGPVVRHFGDPNHWRFAAADVADEAALSAAVRQAADGRPITAWLHMAALTPSPEVEATDPLSVIRVNAFGTACALETARRLGVRRFVVTSSAAVYRGDGDDERVTESAPLRTDRVYAITKQNGERLITYYAERFGLETAAVRMCAIYGPMERPTGARTIMSPIHVAVDLARRGQPVLVAPAALALRRDWLHAMDAARGLSRLLDGPPPAERVYNLGPGEEHTIEATLNTLAHVVPGFTWQPAAADQANLSLPLDGRRASLDISRLQRERQWSPQFGLAEGIADYVAWLDAETASEPA